MLSGFQIADAAIRSCELAKSWGTSVSLPSTCAGILVDDSIDGELNSKDSLYSVHVIL